MTAYPFALQLYSVRDYCEADTENALLRVSEAGFTHVETAGFYAFDAATFKGMLDRAGLTPVSMHAGFEQIVGALDEVIAQAKTLGVEYVVVPWLGEEVCPDGEHWLLATKQMDAAGAALAAAGLRLCYHNHDHEFKTFDGVSIFDLIFENSEAVNLSIELDTCWATVGGNDPVTLLSRYAGRVPLVHIKDCKPTVPGAPVVFTEPGRGIMNWDAVLPAAKAAGARWFIVEQDESEGDSMESAAVGAAFMTACNRA